MPEQNPFDGLGDSKTPAKCFLSFRIQISLIQIYIFIIIMLSCYNFKESRRTNFDERQNLARNVTANNMFLVLFAAEQSIAQYFSLK